MSWLFSLAADDSPESKADEECRPGSFRDNNLVRRRQHLELMVRE
jgi:hypothetical protein